MIELPVAPPLTHALGVSSTLLRRVLDAPRPLIANLGLTILLAVLRGLWRVFRRSAGSVELLLVFRGTDVLS